MKVIYNSFLPFPGFTAMNLCGLILARRESKPLQAVTLRHEAIHTAQMRETLYVGFYLLYLLEWFIKLFIYGREAYRNISFEREAYRYAAYENYLEERRAYAWLRLIIHNSRKMQLLNRSLRLDYAGYYDRLNGWKRKNIEFREGELDESLLYKYCGLWMNDQIYRLLMEIEKHLTNSGLYRREAKHHFLEAKKEMRRYNALLPSRHNLSDERFAEVMQNMEDLLKPSLDILCFSVSQQLLYHDLTGELNSLLSKIVVVGMLSAANKVIVEHFREETTRLVGVPSPHLDFLYMERLKDDMSRLDAALFPTLQGIDLTESGEVRKAFNTMVRKMTSKREFGRAIRIEQS